MPEDPEQMPQNGASDVFSVPEGKKRKRKKAKSLKMNRA
jgi:hypothetical protein